MKPDIKKAKKYFERLLELAAQGNSPLKGMTEKQIIEQLRKTREELWNKKIKNFGVKRLLLVLDSNEYIFPFGPVAKPFPPILIKNP